MNQKKFLWLEVCTVLSCRIIELGGKVKSHLGENHVANVKKGICNLDSCWGTRSVRSPLGMRHRCRGQTKGRPRNTLKPGAGAVARAPPSPQLWPNQTIILASHLATRWEINCKQSSSPHKPICGHLKVFPGCLLVRLGGICAVLTLGRNLTFSLDFSLFLSCPPNSCALCVLGFLGGSILCFGVCASWTCGILTAQPGIELGPW